MDIAILGTGYVGLVAAAAFAEMGHNVVALDVNQEKINDLSQGKVTIYEAGLQDLVVKNLANKRLRFSTKKSDIKPCSACFIAVGTPHNEKTNAAELKYFFAAIDDILNNINQDILIINKSTVPIGTSKKVTEIIKNSNYNIDYASNPEFLSQGSAVKDFLQPARIVIGAETAIAKEKLTEIYYPLIKDNPELLINTNIVTAELIKYASNSFLATKVAFINEIAAISNIVSANIFDIVKAMKCDPRIGREFLNPGPGFGGSCFPKDTKALHDIVSSLNVSLPLVENIAVSNDNIISFIAQRITNLITENQIKSVAILGLTFKANTDDIRQSQPIKIIQYINDVLGSDINIYLHDPLAAHNAAQYLNMPNIQVIDQLSDVISKSEICCFCTEWDIYKKLDDKLLSGKKIIDLRNIFPDKIGDKNYYSWGNNI